MDALVLIYGGAGPWITGPDAAALIPLDNVLLRSQRPHRRTA